MMKRPVILIFYPAILIVISLSLYNFKVQKSFSSSERNSLARHYRIVFYNTENLFDVYDDSLTNDDEFTARGALHWNKTRYLTKLQNLSKVLVAVGEWQPPDIIGLCEVENHLVLEDLTRNTNLSKFNYQIVHKDSEDPRGIDVGLLYNSQTVTSIASNFYSLTGKGYLTREILYFKALLYTDTCHFFVNHWPSRSGGQLESEPARAEAAMLLRTLVDSIFTSRPDSRIIVMGDFNDEPEDISLSYVLQAQTRFENPTPDKIYNLAAGQRSNTTGTIKYQGQWSVFDQIIVSGSLLSPENRLRTDQDKFRIFAEDFLLTEDEQYNGKKPFRTYLGYSYQSGFSDHLPVYIDLDD